MERPSICVVRYNVGCSTERSSPWARASNWNEASTTETTNVAQEICKHRVRRSELKRHIVELRFTAAARLWRPIRGSWEGASTGGVTPDPENSLGTGRNRGRTKSEGTSIRRDWALRSRSCCRRHSTLDGAGRRRYRPS